MIPWVHFHCFLPSSGLERDKFDNKTVTFEEHIKVEHNMWHYLFFIVLVKVKDSTEYTGPESYVAEMIRVRFVAEMCTFQHLFFESPGPCGTPELQVNVCCWCSCHLCSCNHRFYSDSLPHLFQITCRRLCNLCLHDLKSLQRIISSVSFVSGELTFRQSLQLA